MPILLTDEIDNFVKAQIINGNFRNESEARKYIVWKMWAREFMASISEARKDYCNGKCEVINEKTTTKFMDQLAKRLLSHHG